MNEAFKSFDLTGRVAIVTGASRGIGKSIASSLAMAGAKVVLSSRDQNKVDEISHDLNSKDCITKGISCHVGKKEQLNALVDSTVEHFGRIDILVNNAATNPYFGPLEEISDEAYDKIMQVNLKSCMQLSNLCYPHLKISANSSIINISSVEGIRPSIGLAIYSVSKAALLMLTKAQAKEWGKDGIRSNAICPGLIKTKFSQAIWSNEQFLNQFTSTIPSNRMAEAEELSSLALFLASDASSYCTGSVFNADGGYLI